MKYFEEVENRDYEKEIVLLADDRVLAISKDGEKVTFREKCDDYFSQLSRKKKRLKC